MYFAEEPAAPLANGRSKKEKWFSPLFLIDLSIMGENPLIRTATPFLIYFGLIAHNLFKIACGFAGDNFSGSKIVSDVFIHFYFLSFFSVTILYHKRGCLSTPFLKVFQFIFSCVFFNAFL